jgi:hypothetical protein
MAKTLEELKREYEAAQDDLAQAAEDQSEAGYLHFVVTAAEVHDLWQQIQKLEAEK